MAKIEYRRSTYAEQAPQLARMVARYNAEHVGKMPTIVLDDRRYRQLEEHGDLAAFFAFDGEKIVAVLSYVIAVSRHYSPDYKIALHDFFYADPEVRSGLVPFNLFRMAESALPALGVKRIFMVDHIRFTSRTKAFIAMGYVPVEVTYEKVLEKIEPPSTLAGGARGSGVGSEP